MAVGSGFIFYFFLTLIQTFLISLGNCSWKTILVASDIAICQCTLDSHWTEYRFQEG